MVIERFFCRAILSSDAGGNAFAVCRPLIVVKIQKPLIIGHRGASALAPENTLAAFKKAIDDGADGIEFDVRLAADGIPVIIHDETLRRTGGIDRRVNEMTSAELAEIDVGSWFAARKKSGREADFSDQRIISLKTALEYLKSFSGVIYIELKCGNEDFAPLSEAVCRVVAANRSDGRIILKSFKLASIIEIRRHIAEIAAAALFDAGIMKMIRSEEFLPALAAEFGANELSIHYSLATPKLAAAARRVNMPITIWTVDSPRWVAKAADVGIAAIITNNPAKLIAARRA